MNETTLTGFMARGPRTHLHLLLWNSIILFIVLFSALISLPILFIFWK